MRKINFYLLLVTLFLGTNAFSQDYATTKGDMLVDFGVGIGRSYGYDGYYDHNYNGYNGYHGGTNVIIPTLTVVVQKAFWDDITIGGFLGYNLYGDKDSWPNGEYKYRVASFFAGARGEYHFNRLIDLESKFDLYAGAVAGVRLSFHRVQYEDNNNSWDDTDSDADPIGGLFGGFRYYFKDNMSVYGEVGWAITPVRAGLCWRL